MEQDERMVADPSEVNAEQGGEAPPAEVLSGDVAGAEERVVEVDSSVRAAASGGAKNHDLEAPSPGSDDEVAAASGVVEGEDHGVFEHPVAAQHFAPGATVAIAHASPLDSYRRLPSRSRKQRSPKPSAAAAAGAPPPAAAPPAGDQPSSPGSPDSDGAESCSSSSPGVRPPSRGRKQPRPDHFIPEEYKATARAKARRTGISLDRFVTSVARGSPASRSEWARNVTAGYTAASGPHATARSPVRWRRRRGVLQASPTGDGDSTASSARRRLRKVWLLFRP